MTYALDVPEPELVGPLAAEYLARIESDRDFARLEESTKKYPDCWGTFTGYPIICEWDLARDAGPLFTEALRVLALKGAVFSLTDGDEQAAELVIAAPVDEMVHAVIAQFTLCVRIMGRTGVSLVHMTDRERFGYDPAEGGGVYTVGCYRAAGWGDPDPRYWIGRQETERRLAELGRRYASIGVFDLGRRHDLTFTGSGSGPRLTSGGAGSFEGTPGETPGRARG
jgi:hypothetical protein